LAADLSLGRYSKATVTHGLTLNGHRIAAEGTLEFNGDQAVAGNGDIVLTGYDGSIKSTGGMVTLGPGITTRIESGSHIIKAINQGTMTSSAGAGIWLYDLVNTGAVTVSNGSRLRLCGTISNKGSITATDSTVYLSNTAGDLGNVMVSRSTIAINGKYGTKQIEGIQQTSSTFKILSEGVLDNADQVLVLKADDRAWELAGGTIVGGKINSTDGTGLLASQGGTLDHVQLDTDVTLRGTSTLLVRNPVAPDRPVTLHMEGSSESAWPNTLAFQGGHALLQDVLGGVHDAGINIARFLERKKVGGVLGVAEGIGTGAVKRHRPG
jgi:hypothetical protein